MTATMLQDDRMTQTLDEVLALENVIEEAGGLVSPPKVCVQLYKLIESPNSSAKSIGKTVEMDPNLAARVLRIVNSAAYHFQSQITTVSRAITILGTDDLCNLVMAIAAVRAVSEYGNNFYTMDEFWHHSVTVGLCSRHLAEEYRLPDADTYFIAGLLHDIGIPVMYAPRPRLCDIVKNRFAGDEHKLAQYERQQFGFDHAAVGGTLLDTWHLPEVLVSAISHHHRASERQADAVLYLAEQLTLARANGVKLENCLPERSKYDPWAVLKVSDKSIDLNKMMKAVEEEKGTVLKALFG